MTKDEHKALIADVLGRASRTDLCDVFVIGIKPNGAGLHIDWSTQTVASLVLNLHAAINEAVNVYAAGLEKKEAAE